MQYCNNTVFRLKTDMFIPLLFPTSEGFVVRNDKGK